MDDGLSIPNTFEAATALWDNLGRTVAHAHLRRAQLVFAILNEPDPNRFGRDWTAEDLGKEWGVTGERIRRYVRTVKVFGDELEGVLGMPKISWTHLEEIARIGDPQGRKDLLAAVQADGLSSNATRERVSILLGTATANEHSVALPKPPAVSKKASTNVPGDASFRTLVDCIAGWARPAAHALHEISFRIGPDGAFAADSEDQMAASGARNELDDLVEAIQALRSLLNNSIPPPEPEKPVLVQVEADPETSGGRILDI